jgi:homoserine kinase type II
MGAFTRLDDAAVAAIAAGFGLAPVTAWRPIAAGTINSNFAIETEAGRFFLRINEGKQEADVLYEAALVGALAAAGVPTPPPRLAVDGRPLVVWAGKLASLFGWVGGRHLAIGEVDPDAAAAVGEALARLHQAGLPVADQHRREGIYTFERIVERYQGVRAGPAAGDAALAPALAVLGEELDWLAARAPLRRASPQGIIHGDLFRDNVLFEDRRLAALIDFEQASTGSLVYDLAVCLNAWCFEEAGADLVLAPSLARAMIEGYQRRRQLDPADRAALPIEVRAAAARFCITRITDVYLAGIDDPAKDFRRYLARLEAWQRLGADALAAWA